MESDGSFVISENVIKPIAGKGLNVGSNDIYFQNFVMTVD
jgi:hypothetical protein